MKSKLSIKGVLTLTATDNTGKVLFTRKHKNLVVITGKTAITKLIGALNANGQVTQFGIGTGVAPVTLNDVAPLTNQYKKAVGAITYPDGSSINFAWSLTTAEGNGLAITEFGLFCFDNSLFSKIVADPINKDNTMTINGNWKLIL